MDAQAIQRAALGAAILSLGACAAPPPPGDSGGRVGTASTTPAEARDDGVLPASLVVFGEQVARELALDLAEGRVYGVGDSDTLVTVVFGDIVNETRIVGTGEFEMVRQLIRNDLMESDVVRERVRFVESRARMEQLRSREWGEEEGLTVRRPDPETTYFLNGSMYRVARGGTNLYSMTFELTHLTTGEVVFADDYTEKRR